MARTAIFDMDGTLLDSDDALAAPFVTLGVSAADITFGHVVADECRRLGISYEAYVSAYDCDAAQPYPGVATLLDGLDDWSICSNKVGTLGRAEVTRLGWRPDVAFFADRFDGPKRLEPVLDAIGAVADDVVYVGDTAHDQRCAEQAGVTFLAARWNPRVADDVGGVALTHPSQVLDHL